MGSSKKSKKDTKQKKHKYSSSNHADKDDSYSPEEKRRRRDSGDDDRRSKHKKQHKKRDKKETGREEGKSSRREDFEERRSKSKPNGKSLKDVEAPVDSSTGSHEGSESLSIEETNRLRAKLGLKPLDVGNGSNETTAEKKDEFVHAPAEDLWEKKKQEDIREKLQAIREKRNMNKKMGKVKKITADDDEMDTASWVQRSRVSDQKRKEAERREKEIAKMDDEFGVGGLVEEEISHMKNKSYTAKDLKGMTVKHSVEMFKEGKSQILTLEDKNILDEDAEDVLVGVNLLDAETVKRNLEIKTKGFGYQAYEEEEVDELGFFKPKSMLSKYDEEIDGVRKDKFIIGAHGKTDTTWVQQKANMKKEIQAQGVSLAPPQLKIASEYLTEEEMFRKRKKKVRKVRKRENFKADDLLPLPGTSSSSDLGTRGKMRRGNIPGWHEGAEGARVDDTSITSTTLVNESKSIIVDEDDAGNELQKALDKARKAKFVQAQMVSEDTGATKVAQHLEFLSKFKIENPASNYSTTISLNSTNEFCRQVGAGSDMMVMLKEEPMHEEAMDDTMDMDIDDQEESSGWNAPDVPEEIEQKAVPQQQEQQVKDDGHAPIEAEPLASGGLAGALKLASRKGYLEEEQKKNSLILTNKQQELLSANYSIEDKNAVDHLDKYAHEKYSKDRSRHDRGIITEFEEKKDYKPTIKIDYVDEAGRLMSAKEAFRKLSHRFHGKGSGKMKQEKRQKKKLESDMMMKMSSTDTPLNTVAMMKDKLRNEASPYIVLSGAGKTFQAGGAGLSKK